jgi:hypothetical protein
MAHRALISMLIGLLGVCVPASAAEMKMPEFVQQPDEDMAYMRPRVVSRAHDLAKRREAGADSHRHAYHPCESPAVTSRRTRRSMLPTTLSTSSEGYNEASASVWTAAARRTTASLLSGTFYAASGNVATTTLRRSTLKVVLVSASWIWRVKSSLATNTYLVITNPVVGSGIVEVLGTEI